MDDDEAIGATYEGPQVPEGFLEDAPAPEVAEQLVPAPLDLFGEPPQTVQQRFSRSELRQWRERLLREGIGPGDYLTKMMADAYDRGEWQRCFECAALLLPYTLPRLSGIVVAPGGGGASGVGGDLSMPGGVLRFAWSPAADEGKG